MNIFEPERETVRLRNAVVLAVTAPTVSLTLDGEVITSVPVYGPMPAAAAKVLVLEQGASLLVLGDAVTAIRNLHEEIEALKAQIGGA